MTVQRVSRLAGALAALTCLVSGVVASVYDPNRNSQEVRILLSAGRNDNVAACGCSGNQVGGLANEATVIANVRTGSRNPLYLVDLGPTASSQETVDAFAQYFSAVGFTAVVPRAAEATLQGSYEVALAKVGVPCTVRPKEGISLVSLKASPHYLLYVGSYDPQRDKETVSKVQRLSDTSRVVIVVDRDDDANRLLSDAPHLNQRSIVLSRESYVPSIGDLGPRPYPQRGEMLSVVIDDGGRFRVSRVPVRTTSLEDEGVKGIVARYYQKKAAATLASDLTDRRSVRLTSARSCSECHAKEANQWSGTRHADALTTLVKAHKEVSECLPCHSTAYATTKVYNPGDPAIRESVSCESCHGSGSRHSYTQAAADIVRKPQPSVCLGCHTQTTDPKFVYSSRLVHVKHS